MLRRFDGKQTRVIPGHLRLVARKLEQKGILTLEKVEGKTVATMESRPRTLDRDCIRRIDNIDAEMLLNALKQIREMGYNSQAARATDTVLGCLRVAEDAIGSVERKAGRR